MKFASKTTDTGHIESLIRVVAMLAKLAKQCALRIGPERMAFSRPGSVRGDGPHKLFCEINSVSFFEEFRLEGWSEQENEIVLEVTLDEFHQCLRSALHASLMKIKLTRKNDVPYLTIEVKVPSSNSATARAVTHDMPVNIVPPRLWSEFAEPDLPSFDVSVYIPAVRTVQKIISAMKTVTGYLVISANRRGGDMTFHIQTDPVEVTTIFKDLIYAEWSDESTQGTARSAERSQRSQLSGRRVTERTDLSRDEEIGGGGNSLSEDRMFSARVDIKTLGQFLASQHSTHYRLIMSIVNHRMLHFCAVSDELRFQYFMPSIDE